MQDEDEDESHHQDSNNEDENTITQKSNSYNIMLTLTKPWHDFFWNVIGDSWFPSISIYTQLGNTKIDFGYIRMVKTYFSFLIDFILASEKKP